LSASYIDLHIEIDNA